MLLVIARKQYKFGDELVEDDFDFDNPIGVYEENDYQVASQHAFTHTMNHGVGCMVVRDKDLDTVKKTVPNEPVFFKVDESQDWN